MSLATSPRNCLIAVYLLTAGVCGCGRVGFEILPLGLGEAPPTLDAGGPADALDAGAEDPSDAAQTPMRDGSPGEDGASPTADASLDATLPLTDAGENDGSLDLPDGGAVFNGHTYALIDTLQDWNASQTACAVLGMQLVQIDDMAEQSFVWSLNGPVDAWIGATDIEQEGVWHWSNGGPQFWSGNDDTGMPVGGRFQYWDPGIEPNNAGAAEHCAIVRTATSGRWTDLPCNLPYAAICESD